MCFYCHKLYYFPYAPAHGHENCPELAKINKSKTLSVIKNANTKQKPTIC